MNENYVSAVGWLSLVCSHVTTRVSKGAFPWLGLRCAGATVHVSIADPRMTLKHRDLTIDVGSLQDGIRAHAECRTRPLS